MNTFQSSAQARSALSSTDFDSYLNMIHLRRVAKTFKRQK